MLYAAKINYSDSDSDSDSAILKCWLYANLYHRPSPFAEDGRRSSGIGRGKSIGLTDGILLPAEAVYSSRSRLKLRNNQTVRNFYMWMQQYYDIFK